jgi:hypothetical protein
MLYPLPGANKSTAKGGGTPKTNIHRSLVKDILGPTENYGALVKAITSSPANAARRNKWGNKVKTCLGTYVVSSFPSLQHLTQALQHANPPFEVRPESRRVHGLGHDGRGVCRWLQEQARLSFCFVQQTTRSNVVFTAEFRDQHPWYNQLKLLVAKQPNLKPHGVGNSRSGFNPAILAAGKDHDSSRQDSPLDRPEHDVSPAGSEDDEDNDAAGPGGPQPRFLSKRTHSPSLSPSAIDVKASDHDQEVPTPSTPAKGKNKAGKSTPTCPGQSKPVESGAPDKKRKKASTSDRFTSTVAEENATKREMIKLRRTNIETDANFRKAKTDAKLRLKERKLEL